jgi:siroheme synthase-like protein
VKAYPVFLVGLDRRTCLVVGGGREAERKVEGLLECDAAVRVIAARVTARIRELAEARKIEWLPREYRDGDLAGSFLVIAAEQDTATSERIWDEARRCGVLANVMDDAERCSFIAGSVLRRGPLTVAISTSGCAPALAVRLRQQLERELGPEYADLLELLRELREPLARRHPDFEARRSAAYALVDSDVLRHLREGRPDRARTLALELAGIAPSTEPAGGGY